MTTPDARTIALNDVVEVPPNSMTIPQSPWSPTARFPRFDFVARDTANRDLGRRGEESVLEYERRRLHDGGQKDLARRIEWITETRGDGAGYDIQSFNADRTPRLIEVKTTGLGKYFPFNVTANEVRCSQARPQEFNLYRVLLAVAPVDPPAVAPVAPPADVGPATVGTEDGLRRAS